MKIPETAQKQTEDIAIGSGYMYIKEYEKGSAIPKISEIAVEDNRKGYLSGGASIYYTPTIDTYKDDMEEITRKILSGEDIGIKGSIGTFMPDTFGIMAPNSEISTDSTDSSSNIYIGGIKNFKDKYYAVVFAAADESMSAMIIGQLEDSRLIDTLEEENIMRKLGRVITTSGEHKMNIAATKPAAAWVEEGGALTFGDATFSQILLDAHKLHVAIKVTEELLYDNAFGLENYIIDQFGKALANAEEDAFLNGTGVGQPLGLFAKTGGGTTAETLTAALKADDILNLIYALKRPYRKMRPLLSMIKT